MEGGMEGGNWSPVLLSIDGGQLFGDDDHEEDSGNGWPTPPLGDEGAEFTSTSSDCLSTGGDDSDDDHDAAGLGGVWHAQPMGTGPVDVAPPLGYLGDWGTQYAGWSAGARQPWVQAAGPPSPAAEGAPHAFGRHAAALSVGSQQQGIQAPIKVDVSVGRQGLGMSYEADERAESADLRAQFVSKLTEASGSNTADRSFSQLPRPGEPMHTAQEGHKRPRSGDEEQGETVAAVAAAVPTVPAAGGQTRPIIRARTLTVEEVVKILRSPEVYDGARPKWIEGNPRARIGCIFKEPITARRPSGTDIWSAKGGTRGGRTEHDAEGSTVRQMYGKVTFRGPRHALDAAGPKSLAYHRWTVEGYDSQVFHIVSGGERRRRHATQVVSGMQTHRLAPGGGDSTWLRFEDRWGTLQGEISQGQYGAVLRSRAGDFAEWHRRHPDEAPFEEGDVVGIDVHGQLSRRTYDALAQPVPCVS
jgi:hypothetical protein|eukprot:COSAG01_NODE_3202_length_6424_cov_634.991781_1_plen_472_part_00